MGQSSQLESTGSRCSHLREHEEQQQTRVLVEQVVLGVGELEDEDAEDGRREGGIPTGGTGG